MKALVGAFNQEKALVGAFSMIVQLVVEPMDRFAALVQRDMVYFLSDYLVQEIIDGLVIVGDGPRLVVRAARKSGELKIYRI